MPFEKFVPPKAPGVRPKATIRPSGLISFDAAAVETFGLEDASRATLYFDRNRKLIGVRPLRKNVSGEEAFKLSRRRRSVSLKALTFFEKYGLKIDDAQKFDASWDAANELITIDVKGVRRRRGRRPKTVS